MKKSISIVIMTISLFLLYACSPENNSKSGETINLNDYVKVSFSGFNQAGIADVYFDKESFMLDNIDNVSYKKESEQVYKELYGKTDKSAAYEVLRFIKVNVDNSYHLNNGDKVKLFWNIDEDKIESYFKIDYIFLEEEFQVADLKEAGTFDPFEGLQLSFSGVAPYGTVSAYNDSNDYGGEYLITPNENLKNGDEIKVNYNVTDISSLISSYGVCPSKYDANYTVSGLQTYVSSVDELTSEQLSKLKTDAIEQLWVPGYGIYYDAIYKGNVFYVAKGEPAHGVHFLKWCGFPVDNAICMVFEHPKDSHDASDKAYTIIALENLIKDEDGNLTYNRFDMWPYETCTSMAEVKDLLIGSFDDIMNSSSSFN
ncbi:hypothetical protein D6853_04985 [Butyrivibrio sp. X503]|uniref:hypothetical protein n=1 Tax=Butyrivibrio sp. X503 TaxID=2364878 RepID=UPI000EA9FB0F|nr:hypothetical protein [Butyrivibrio sp. X503]RKM57370.1 hypothetical protein D6853_04985 [Butyrivibrio sp. X503]